MSDHVEQLEVTAFRVPTEGAESDGTFAWDSTTLVVVEVEGAGSRGLGYTYASVAAAHVVAETLREVVLRRDPMAVLASAEAMRAATRGVGAPGLAAMARSAVDVALWDLKARLVGLPLVDLLGLVRSRVPVYGSGGFTSLSIDALSRQLAGWVAAGIPRVEMKVGRRPDWDPTRVRAAREAVGGETELYVDADGAFRAKQALQAAFRFVDAGVTWFEEPVPADDLVGLRAVRERAPLSMEVAAGEYAWDGPSFRRLLEAGAVDVLQADATRCGGVSGFLEASVLASVHDVALSSHGAPQLHAHLGCASPPLRHVEYFHDHVRIERLLFDGALELEGGTLRPDRSRPGLGLELKRADAEPYLAYESRERAVAP